MWTSDLSRVAPPSAMDLGLTYRALAEHRVDVIAGNSTDGQIAALDLVRLEDNRSYFPPYQAAPVARIGALQKNPAVLAALAELAGKITDARCAGSTRWRTWSIVISWQSHERGSWSMCGKTLEGLWLKQAT